MTASKFVKRLLVLAIIAMWFGSLGDLVQAAERWQFNVKLANQVRPEPFSGRVYIIFSQKNIQPRFGPDWFTPELFIAKDVKNWKAGDTLTFSSGKRDGLLAFPSAFESMDLAGYRAQAVARFNPHDREVGIGAGNGFSEVIKVGQTGETYELTISDVAPSKKYKDNDWSKELRVRSELLSKFHSREVFQEGAVLLPASYAKEPDRRYPVIYTIPGFSGEHYAARIEQPIEETNSGNVEFIRVLLNPSCPLGHHVFADSANNGPYGRCLTEEFIPELDRRFRTIAEPSARFVTGHSSGGWSSLWLQITYPDFFGGVWSTAPDSVDFTDFNRVNLYKDKNFYVDEKGEDRPIARVAGQVRLWLKSFASMEHTLGHGGQLHSFEAVFSDKGTDGLPQLIWNRDTGEIDHAVAKTWEKYDIRLILERNWKDLGPKLTGKVNVFMGSQDTFYLEGATINLKASLEKLGSTAVVEIHPGRDHSNLLAGDLRLRIRREMVESFLKNHPKEKR